MAHLSRDQAYKLAEAITELGPWSCRVNIFGDDTAAYEATISVELGDPTMASADIDVFVAKLRGLQTLADDAGIRMKLSSTAVFLLDANV